MTPQRILVRAPQWLGDAVVSTVFLKRLRHRYPDSQIAVACASGVAPVFSTHPDVNTVITLPYPAGNVWKAAQMLAAEDFDTAYVLPRSFRAALESWLARIPQRIGYEGDVRRALLTKAVPCQDQLLYAHRYLRLIDEQDLSLNTVTPHFPSEKPLEEPKLQGPILGIAPVSIAPARTWSAERFALVANAFIKKNGGSVILFGSPKEKSAVNAVAERITEGPVINTAGNLSLTELGWLMSQCNVLLANDSGLMHVASCFQIPSVVLFGPSDPKFALPPWGKFTSIQKSEIFCVPCLRNTCARFGSDRDVCMTSISAVEVAAAIQKHLVM